MDYFVVLDITNWNCRRPILLDSGENMPSPTFTVLEPITNTLMKADLIAVYNSGDARSEFRFRFFQPVPKFQVGMGLMVQNDSTDLFLMKINTVEYRHHDDATDIVVEKMPRLLGFVALIEAENTKLLSGSSL